MLLVLLDPRRAVLVLGALGHDLLLDVVDALNDAARREKQAAQHELLDGVGIGARRVEDRDATARHIVDRDVVGARAAPSDRTHSRLDLI